MHTRPTLLNLALAGNVKIELIGELLIRGRHEIEILSQGEVVERQWKFFPSLQETTPAPTSIPVYYSSVLPVRFVNGYWSSRSLRSLFQRRHTAAPFDLVLLYNLKQPQVACARYALHDLKLPVVIEYEDDAFVEVDGKIDSGLRNRLHLKSARNVLVSAAGCLGVSPYLLSQFPAPIPKLLLRGVVDERILKASQQPVSAKANWVVYSGTHFRSKGLEPLIAAWKQLNPPGWELHLSGRGELTDRLTRLAENDRSIVFHGLLERDEYTRFLGQAKIGINPHDVSQAPGNVFAFKIVEYLAAGLHVISTPMGQLEPELEAGITYMPDNTPDTISSTLRRVIGERVYERIIPAAAYKLYGPDAVALSLNKLLWQAAVPRGAGS